MERAEEAEDPGGDHAPGDGVDPAIVLRAAIHLQDHRRAHGRWPQPGGSA